MTSRRDFIQKMTGSAIAVSLLPRATNRFPALQPASNPDGRVLRVAIMGLGYYATLVADAMQHCTRAKLVGAISGTPSKLTAWQAKYGIPVENCYNYQTYEQIRSNPNID